MALATAVLGAACTGNQAAPQNKANVKSADGAGGAGYGGAGGGYGAPAGGGAPPPADNGGGYGGAPTGGGAGPADSPQVLKVAAAGPLNNVVTDGQGHTLYRFDKDKGNPSTSNCEGPCAEAWPPVLVNDGDNNNDNVNNNVNVNNNTNVINLNNVVLQGGIDKARLGTLQRKDGTKQLTLGGWPMYRYAKDTAPGQANGEGAQGTWWAAAFNGTKAKDGGTPPMPGTTVLRAMPAGPFPKVATDGEGFTLYRFDKDVPNKMSNCNGDCAKTWPPVMAQDNMMLYGIDRNQVGMITRADGSKQVTLGGWPLYRYAKDTAACQTNGEGVQGTWFTSAVDGKKAKDVFKK